VRRLGALCLTGSLMFFVASPVLGAERLPPDSIDPAAIAVIDNFDDGIMNWWPPDRSGTFSGIASGGAAVSSAALDPIHDRAQGHPHANGRAMRLDFHWDTAAPFVEPAAGGSGSHLVRLHMPRREAEQPQRRFGPGQALMVFVLGDGSANRFRFLIRDGKDQIEGSGWYTVDWEGWRRVVWDFNRDPVQGWVSGDGHLDGRVFYFDSFLITMNEAVNALSGRLHFDDLRAIPAGMRPEEPLEPAGLARDRTPAETDIGPSVLPDRWLRERRSAQR